MWKESILKKITAKLKPMTVSSLKASFFWKLDKNSRHRNIFVELFIHQLAVNSSIASFWKLDRNARHRNNFGTLFVHQLAVNSSIASFWKLDKTQGTGIILANYLFISWQ